MSIAFLLMLGYIFYLFVNRNAGYDQMYKQRGGFTVEEYTAYKKKSYSIFEERVLSHVGLFCLRITYGSIQTQWIY